MSLIWKIRLVVIGNSKNGLTTGAWVRVVPEKKNSRFLLIYLENFFMQLSKMVSIKIRLKGDTRRLKKCDLNCWLAILETFEGSVKYNRS